MPALYSEIIRHDERINSPVRGRSNSALLAYSVQDYVIVAQSVMRNKRSVADKFEYVWQYAFQIRRVLYVAVVYGKAGVDWEKMMLPDTKRKDGELR